MTAEEAILKFALPITGAVTTLLTFFNVLLVLEREFSTDEQIVAGPLQFAAPPSLQYRRFHENNWQAYSALWFAMRFRVFYQRFRPLLDPDHARLCLLILTAGLIGLYVVARVEKCPLIFEGSIGGVAALLNICWRLVIGQARTLKRRVERHRVH